MNKLLEKLQVAIQADKKEYALDILELIKDTYGENAATITNGSNSILNTYVHTTGVAVPLPQYHDDHKIDEAAMLDNGAASLLSAVKNSTIKE